MMITFKIEAMSKNQMVNLKPALLKLLTQKMTSWLKFSKNLN